MVNVNDVLQKRRWLRNSFSEVSHKLCLSYITRKAFVSEKSSKVKAYVSLFQWFRNDYNNNQLCTLSSNAVNRLLLVRGYLHVEKLCMPLNVLRVDGLFTPFRTLLRRIYHLYSFKNYGQADLFLSNSVSVSSFCIILKLWFFYNSSLFGANLI